jgi:micrococcal nuclease
MVCRSSARTALIAAAVLAQAALAVEAPPAERLQGDVVRVESGDTFVLNVDGRTIEVRLSDIAAPQGSQFYAPAARALLSGIVQGQRVTVDVTGRAAEASIFGRVQRGRLDVNLELVRRGAAWVCWEYSASTDYLPWENQAQRARRGVWSSTPEITALAECRRRPPAERPLYPRT